MQAVRRAQREARGLGRGWCEGISTKKTKQKSDWVKAEGKKSPSVKEQLTATASKVLCKHVFNEQDPQNRSVFQKTDLQLSSKNVLQFYSLQKPQRLV